MSFYKHATFEVGPTRVNPIQDSNRWRERTLIEGCHANRTANMLCVSPSPYRWEENPISNQVFRRRAKAPKDLNKEILTANEMMKQAVRLRKHFQQDIQAAGIAINANQAKPSVLPTSASPEWLPPAPVRCETPGTPLVYEVQLERQRRQEAEDEIDRLKAELRACRSRTSSTTTTRSSGHWPSRETQTPRSTSRSAHLDAINCFGEPPRGTKGPNGADRARKKWQRQHGRVVRTLLLPSLYNRTQFLEIPERL